LRRALLQDNFSWFARMAELTPDYSKRDCSLPPGCKDLIDVLRLQKRKLTKADLVEIRLHAMGKKSGMLPPKAEAKQPPSFATIIEIKDPVTVKDLAALLGRKPFEIMASLIDLGIIATPTDRLDFDIVARVARKYGYIAKRAPS
jgi:hypothetical protein